jgi:hypothetical protein
MCCRNTNNKLGRKSQTQYIHCRWTAPLRATRRDEMRCKKTEGGSTTTRKAQLAQAVTVLACIPEMLDLNLVQATEYTEIYSEFPHSTHKSARIIP